MLAIGTSPITSVDGTEQGPARNIVRAGDYIEYVDGALLKDKEALVAAEKVTDHRALRTQVAAVAEKLVPLAQASLSS